MSFFLQFADHHLHIITHQIKFLQIVTIMRMHCDLSWRKLENKPASPGVHMGKAKNILDEIPIGFRIGAVDNDMRSCDHVSKMMVDRPKCIL